MMFAANGHFKGSRMDTRGEFAAALIGVSVICALGSPARGGLTEYRCHEISTANAASNIADLVSLDPIMEPRDSAADNCDLTDAMGVVFATESERPASESASFTADVLVDEDALPF